MEPVWAEETILNRSGELTPEGVYDLVLRATGDKMAAEKAQARKVLRDRIAQAKAASKR